MLQMETIRGHEMKILIRGQIPEDECFVETCPNCKTVFNFKRSEATLHTVAHSCDPREGNYNTVTCPLCFKDFPTFFKTPYSTKAY